MQEIVKKNRDNSNLEIELNQGKSISLGAFP